ncbi:MAG: SHOCT domain-containing protein [Clostridia bacterium]|nr:SHOCT domain-containing protein [Clostridia bacterium]
MALGVLKFFFDNKIINKAVKILMIVGVSLTAWYMLEGIAFSSVLDNFGKWIRTSSSAFLSFILCALTFAGYIVFDKLYKVDGETTFVAVKEKGASVKSQKSQMSSIQLLKEYKDLLDAGVISQEEFDQKKKELL